jgi:CRISPR-associated helicase Cas3
MGSIMRVLPLYLETAPHPGAARAGLGGDLYRHQAELFDQWKTRDAFVLATPTGSGKTQAALLPCLANDDSAIFLYPTNALIEDQVRSFHALAERIGVLLPEISAAGEGPDVNAHRAARAFMARVDAQALEDLRRLWMFRTKGRALSTLLGHQEKPLLVLTNPDTLFLMVAQRYAESAAALGALQDVTLVVDEFHLYSGVALARLLFMAYFLMKAPRRMVGRVVFLSATPSDEVATILTKLFDPLFIRHTPSRDNAGRVVQYELTLDAVPIGGRASSQMAQAILGQRAQLLAERHALDIQRESASVPLLAITDSVFGSIELEDTLRSAEVPFAPAEIGVYRGLSNRSIRDTKNKLVVLGTSAIEVGVDFHTGRLIFEAGSAEAFVQRIGRLGRHGPGAATLFAPDRVARAIAASPEIAVPRDELMSLARRWYPSSATYAWFAQSRHGLAVAKATLQRLDELAEAQGVSELRDQLRVMVQEYAAAIGAEEVPRRFSQWVGAYSKVQSFRGSGSIEVYDHREAARRREAVSGKESPTDPGHYEADLATLLRYGQSVAERINTKGEPYAVIFGYARPREVRVTIRSMTLSVLAMADSVAATFAVDVSAPHLCAYYRRPGHICVLLPGDFEHRLQRDWRIRYYRSEYGLVLFDDDALLALAMYEQGSHRDPEHLRPDIRPVRT